MFITRVRLFVFALQVGAICVFPLCLFSADVEQERKAAEKGDAEAQYQMGLRHENGDVVIKNYAEAARYYRLAAEQGHVLSGFSLGEAYLRGHGVPLDAAEAFKWLNKAASNGDASAQYFTGWMHENGLGTKKDPVEAMNSYRKAVENGNIRAAANLGALFQEGRGRARDLEEAVKWYRKGAEAGHAEAQTYLGCMFEEGIGVPKDQLEATKWFRLAAESGEQCAQYNLGVRYKSGQVIPQDTVEAYVWLSLAAAQNMELAKKERDKLEKQMSPPQVIQAQQLALKWRPKPPPASISASGFSIASLAFAPSPAQRGKEGKMCVHYKLTGPIGKIHETWSLFHNGESQFPPQEFDYTPTQADAQRQIPLPVPANIAAGTYELRLKATVDTKSLEAKYSFTIE